MEANAKSKVELLRETIEAERRRFFFLDFDREVLAGNKALKPFNPWGDRLLDDLIIHVAREFGADACADALRKNLNLAVSHLERQHSLELVVADPERCGRELRFDLMEDERREKADESLVRLRENPRAMRWLERAVEKAGKAVCEASKGDCGCFVLERRGSECGEGGWTAEGVDLEAMLEVYGRELAVAYYEAEGSHRERRAGAERAVRIRWESK